ncbi:MAG: hypothetical protein HY814_01475 [Candidatus Riflebacteria bacterium]|nr:hypothetical protein [Candidatus Riflebacteria bacterium]
MPVSQLRHALGRSCRPWIGALLLLTAASPALALTPVWEQGLTWTVSTVYRTLQLGTAEAGPPGRKAEWSTPTNWVFFVSRVQRYKDGFHYLVQVKDREHRSSALASLVFASYKLGNGQTALSLLRGKLLRMVRGSRVVSEFQQNEFGDTPRPVLSEQSIIPYDFPSFPILEPRGKALKRTFEVTEELPPLKFAKDLVQGEETGLSPRSFAPHDLEKRSGFKSTPPEQMVFVSLTREMDGTQVHQIWVPDLPWALSSDTGSSRSVLIYHSREAAHPGSPRGTDTTAPGGK